MARMGFIHDKLDTKLLILYIMSRVAGPIDFPTLTDLTLCDDGVDYFDFAESVAELVNTGHLLLENGLYSITEKGKRNGADCESSLSSVVRRKCDHSLTRLNAQLRRNASVQTAVTPLDDGTCTLRLTQLDNAGPLLTVEMVIGSQDQARQMARQFRAHPDRLLHGIVELLLPAEEGET